MPDLRDLLPPPPWEGPPIPRGFMYWTRVSDWFTNETLYEYHSVFADIDEAVTDARYMVEEGHIPYKPTGYIVAVYDSHPDVPGTKLLVEGGFYVSHRDLRYLD